MKTNVLKKLGLGVSAFACFMTMGVQVSATETGTTKVYYDNRNVVDGDGNGQWGVVLPTAITFTDDKSKVVSTIELTGLGGYDLENDFTTLDVEISVESDNGGSSKFELKNAGGDKSIDYSVTDEGDASLASNKKFNLSLKDQSYDITATLTGNKTGLTKESYSDKLTFTINGTNVEYN